jgi:nitrogen fixation-related uncharacterized protein
MGAFLHLLLVLNTIALGMLALAIFAFLWTADDERSRHEREVRHAEARLSEISRQAQAAILAEVVQQTTQCPGSSGLGEPPRGK